MTRPIRTVVADDHALFREGVVAILDASPDIDVMGTASTGTEAVSVVAELRPDVVLMDLMMPEIDGIEATARCREVSPDTAVIIVTMVDDHAAVFAAMCAGARGYLLKGANSRSLQRAIHSVAAGDVLFSAGIAGRVLGLFEAAGDDASTRLRPFPELTQREYEILTHVADGLSNAEIGRRLSLAPKTIANNLSQVFQKLQVSDRAQAMVKAHRAGLGP